MTRSSRAGIDLDAEVAEEQQALDDRGSHVRPVLADAAREREHVEAAERHRHLRHGARDPVRVDREAERVVEPPERREPRLVLESGVEVVDSQAVLPEEVDQGPRVDGAGAGGHRHAFERGEPHRRVDRAPVEHRGHRAAAAQVAGHDPRGVEPRDDRLHRDPVEPVAAHAPVAPALRNRVRRGLGGNRGVERRVEDGDVGHVGQGGARLADRAQCRRVVRAARCATARRSPPRPRRRSAPAPCSATLRGRRGARPRPPARSCPRVATSRPRRG